MRKSSHSATGLPTAGALRRAVQLFLRHAYPGKAPPSARRFLPGKGCDLAAWLMSSLTERTPKDAPLEQVKSFDMRIGNVSYPHMKLRLAHPPNDVTFVFSVTAHDAMLQAPPGSPDRAALEQLKQHNAAVAEAITHAWDAADLPTEHSYLRQKIRRARTT